MLTFLFTPSTPIKRIIIIKTCGVHMNDNENFFSLFSSLSTHTNTQKNLKYKWSFNSTIDNLIELPAHSNDIDLHHSMQQHDYHQPQHIETISHKTKNNNYNSIELHPRQTYSSSSSMKKYQQQSPNINYHNSISQSYIDSSSSSAASSVGVSAIHGGHHHHMQQQQQQQGVYFYKIENFTSFGTISCSAENSYGSSGPCLYHIMVAG